MIQRCPYNPVTALLLHQLKQEMMLSWPSQNVLGASCHDQDAPLALSDKGPFVTFGAALAMDAVPHLPRFPSAAACQPSLSPSMPNCLSPSMPNCPSCSCYSSCFVRHARRICTFVLLYCNAGAGAACPACCYAFKLSCFVCQLVTLLVRSVRCDVLE